jgi:SAM-dependent methyltransferase
MKNKKNINNIPENFDEVFYLKANPDVARDVELNIWKNGLEHYLMHGREDNRKFCRPDAHFVRDYELLVSNLLKQYPNNKELALAQAIGAGTIEEFIYSGDLQVSILQIFGLQNGMFIYDLACGCGRTAQALRRINWKGQYIGADIIKSFIDHLNEKCPDYKGIVHRDLTINSSDNSLDIIYSWSLFTHLHHEEIYLYMLDSFRALKPNGKLIFSFLEHNSDEHQKIFFKRVEDIKAYKSLVHLDTFLHRDFINQFAYKIGFQNKPIYIDGNLAATKFGPFFQSIACLQK